MDNVDVGFRYRLWVLIGVAILLSVAASAVGETAAVQGNLFVPVPPCRMFDTRLTANPMQQGEYRNVTLTGDCGIPAGVVAVSTNIAAANIQGGVNTNGVLKVGLPAAPAAPDSVPQACGIPNPCEAWLNYTKPYTTQVNNSGVAVVDSHGQIILGLFQGGGTADVIVDVNGYYVPGVTQVSLIAGTGSCGTSSFTSWSKCVTTITDPRVKAGMLFATTYNTRQADDQIPVRIFNVINGSFQAEIQGGTTFSWIATTP